MDLLNHVIQAGDLFSQHQRNSVHQRLINNVTAGRLADAGIPRIVGQYHDITGKPGTMRPADVQQHAVVTGHRNDFHIDNRRTGLSVHH